MKPKPQFLTLQEATVLVDTLNQITSEAATEMNRLNRHAKTVYAEQLRDILLLVESETERNKLARYVQRVMVVL